MSAKKSKGPIFDPGLCRCCGTMKKCRVLNVEYDGIGSGFGEKEIYSDMIMDCYGFLVSYLDGKPSERLICATCVTRLRDALAFRKQVMQCEEAFLQMKMYDAENDDMESKLGRPQVEVEIVKLEPPSPASPEPEPEPMEHVEECSAGRGSEDEDDAPLQRLRERAPPLPAAPAAPLAAPLPAPLPVPAAPLAAPPGPAVSTALVVKTAVEKPDIPMSKLQQRMRERDPTYIRETNILTIVEYSYVIPFKCRHNYLMCYYCGDQFLDPHLLREHTEKSHNPKKFKVFEHKNMVKIEITNIDCRLCSAKINSLDDFKKHISSVHNKKYYFDFKDNTVLPFKLAKDEMKCALCDVFFSYFHALNKHMNEHYSNYVCETCGLGFVDKGRFLMHQQRHEEANFPCPTCGKVFKAIYNRDLHIDRVHKKRGRVYCPKCDAKLMSYHQKLKHLVEVHGETPLSFPCPLCARVCDSRRMLTVHRRKDHLKDYRYECQCCGQKFFTRFALNNHMPVHTRERNFKCSVCEKSYPRLKTLKDHMRIHTNDRRYRCHICGQAFIQNCSLKGHMKSQHPEYG